MCLWRTNCSCHLAHLIIQTLNIGPCLLLKLLRLLLKLQSISGKRLNNIFQRHTRIRSLARLLSRGVWLLILLANWVIFSRRLIYLWIPIAKIEVIPPSRVIHARIGSILPLQLSRKTTYCIHLLNGFLLKSWAYIDWMPYYRTNPTSLHRLHITYNHLTNKRS